MINEFSIANKVALITGGGTGIGLGIAKILIEAGAKVVISGRREDVLKEAVLRLGKSSRYVVNDIAKLDEIKPFLKEVETLFGAVDILVNNAGIHLKKNVFDTEDTDLANILNTNLTSVFSLSREVAKSMQQRKYAGSIILISSMSAFMAIDRVAAYSVSKAGVLGIMNAMVADFAEFGIRVNTIVPGWIESDMMLKAINADEKRKNKITGRIPLKRFGSVDDIGNACLFLCSARASYINGVALPVDGGALIGF